MDDVRITTRYSEGEFLSSLTGVIHETGHGLYELGLDRINKTQPAGGSMGMAAHESQSLFWEMQIARSPEFAEFSKSKLSECFMRPGFENAFSADNIHAHMTRVEPGFIRVDADELTYPLHVVLRYEIEKMIFHEEIDIEKLPEVWAEKMRDYFGLDPKDKHSLGVLQDCHWPGGAFGYFPCYSLGAMIAYSIKAAMNKSLPNIREDIANGEFTKINKWLNDNIHSKGRVQTVSDLLTDMTGGFIDTNGYLDFLSERYLGSY